MTSAVPNSTAALLKKPPALVEKEIINIDGRVFRVTIKRNGQEISGKSFGLSSSSSPDINYHSKVDREGKSLSDTEKFSLDISKYRQFKPARKRLRSLAKHVNRLPPVVTMGGTPPKDKVVNPSLPKAPTVKDKGTLSNSFKILIGDDPLNDIVINDYAKLLLHNPAEHRYCLTAPVSPGRVNAGVIFDTEIIHAGFKFLTHQSVF